MILKDVRMNKIKTFFIVTLFFVFITLFVYFISLYFLDDIYLAAFIGFAFAFFSAFISYYNCKFLPCFI